MDMMPKSSILRLQRLQFLKLKFRRLGDGSDKEVQHQVRGELSEDADKEAYRVVLEWRSHKENEYEIEIKLEGIFSFETNETIAEELKEELLRTNTFAIMMPYIRSELTLLTSQPGMKSIVLPPLNVAAMMNNKEE